jgi:hypothetical protein
VHVRGRGHSPDFEAAAGDNAATELTIRFGGQLPTTLLLQVIEGVRSEDIVPAEDALEDVSFADAQADAEDDAGELKDELHVAAMLDEILCQSSLAVIEY